MRMNIKSDGATSEVSQCGLPTREEEQLLAEKLCDAVVEKHFGLCEVLLVLRAKGDYVCESRGGLAPIHWAVGLQQEQFGSDSLHFLKLLLQYGSNPNVRSSSGITPVHLSAMLGSHKGLKLLLNSGGDPNITDFQDLSAFDHGWFTSTKVKKVLQKYMHQHQKSLSSSSESDMSDVEVFNSPPLNKGSRIRHSRQFFTGAISKCRQRQPSCDLCFANKQRKHFEKQMMKAMGVHFLKYFSVKSKTLSDLNYLEKASQKCFCSDKRNNVSYPMEEKLKSWYNGSGNTMNNFIKSLTAKSHGTFSPRSVKKDLNSEVPSRCSHDDENVRAMKLEKEKGKLSNDECSDLGGYKSQSSASTSSSIESAQNLLNMQISESDLDKISLLDGKAVGLKQTTSLDVSSPRHPVLRKKNQSKRQKKSCHCSCNCEKSSRSIDLDVTVASIYSQTDCEIKAGSLDSIKEGQSNSEQGLLNNQVQSRRSSASNSPLMFWKKRNNLDIEKDQSTEKQSLHTSYKTVPQNKGNSRTSVFSNCSSPTYWDFPRYSSSSVKKEFSEKDFNESELWESFVDEEKENTVFLKKKAKKKGKRCFQKADRNLAAEVKGSTTSHVVQNNPTATIAPSMLCNDAFSSTVFKNEVQKTSTESSISSNVNNSKKTSFSSRRVTFSDQLSSRSNSSSENLSPKDSSGDFDSITSQLNRNLSPATLYRDLFKSYVDTRTSMNISKSSGLRREGDCVFEEVLIKPKVNPNESLMTNDLGDQSFATDWKSCRSTRSKQNSPQTSRVAMTSLENSFKSCSLKVESCGDSSTQSNLAIEIPESLARLSNEEIREQLMTVKCRNVGPVTDTTRGVYLKILAGFHAKMDGSFEKTWIEAQKDCVFTKSQSNQFDSNPNEFPRLLSDYLNVSESCVVTSLPDLEGEEQLMVSLFNDATRNWREGTRKRSFTYLLLDPRVTRNIQTKIRDLSELETFRFFVSAIFYVGKGQSSRPLTHFQDAVKHLKASGDAEILSKCEKIAHIQSIWNSGYGVVNLQCFQNTIPVEAYTREALIISALGLNRLTNQRKGDFYGVTSSWDESRRQQLGIYLLKKAMKIFIQEGERQIRPADF